MPFLSIIIPVYNKGKYLNKCLRSIAKQSFTDWEVVLVDDGSYDNSPDICDEWAKKDSRFLVIHKTNGGVSTARNAGLKLVTGQYVQFTDADDWWEPEAFNFLYKECSQHGSPDVLIYGITKIFPNGEKSIVQAPISGDFNKKHFFSSLIQGQAETGIYGGVWSKLTRREIIRHNNLEFNQKYNLMEDFDFFLDVYQCSETISVIPHCGYCYLQEAENATSSSNFRFHYPSIMEIRVKAWQITKTICGSSANNDTWLQHELNNLYLGMFTVLENISLSRIQELDREVKNLLPKGFTLNPAGISFNTSIIAWLLNHNCFTLLFLYLSFRNKFNNHIIN